MRIEYRETKEGVELIRLFGEGKTVRVPEKIGDLPVVRIAPYAFSALKEKEDSSVFVWEEELDGERIWNRELPMQCGGLIEEIYLPSQIVAVGNYAFYGCRNLRRFHASDSLVRMGSGVFTGCRLNGIEIDFYKGQQSCLKEILNDIRYEVLAVVRYHGEAGTVFGMAKVLFPEYYADAVENTPARIVETHYYGSGGEYRECFYRKELDYGKYDRIFALSCARDETASTANLALGRLLYPYRLKREAEKRYQEYLKTNMKELIQIWLEESYGEDIRLMTDPTGFITYCCREHLFSRETIEEAICLASEHGQAELAGRLMEERKKSFPVRRKTFEL